MLKLSDSECCKSPTHAASIDGLGCNQSDSRRLLKLRDLSRAIKITKIEYPRLREFYGRK